MVAKEENFAVEVAASCRSFLDLITHLLSFFLLLVEASVVEADPSRVTKNLAVAVVSHLKKTAVFCATFMGAKCFYAICWSLRYGTVPVPYCTVCVILYDSLECTIILALCPVYVT